MRTIPTEDQVERAAKAIFGPRHGYRFGTGRTFAVDKHWRAVSPEVRDMYMREARTIVEAALGAPYA